MSSPYESVEVTNYNSNAPPNDGSKTQLNQVDWNKHKTKLADPLKTAIEALNTNVQTAFESLLKQTADEATNLITPTNFAYFPGDVRRYGAVLDGVTDDTTAFNNAIKSGHPAFCNVGGTANIEGTIVLTTGQALTLNPWCTLERQSGSSTAPMVHMYGERIYFNGENATIRQDLYAHPKGIFLVGQDPAETFGGTTDIATRRCKVSDLKIVGPVKNISQDGSPGLYIHSIRRKLYGASSADRQPTYFCDFENIDIVNCDVCLEFSTDANSHTLRGLLLHQFKEAAIIFNGSLRNKVEGSIEAPLEVSPTARFAVQFLPQNGSQIETDTNASYGVTAAFRNEVDMSIELPSPSGNTVVRLMKEDLPGSSASEGNNKCGGMWQAGGGIGEDGTSEDAGIGETLIDSNLVLATDLSRPLRFGDFRYRKIDQGSGNVGSLFYNQSWALACGRLTAITTLGSEHKLVRVDNIDPSQGGILAVVFACAKDGEQAFVEARTGQFLADKTSAGGNVLVDTLTTATAQGQGATNIFSLTNNVGSDWVEFTITYGTSLTGTIEGFVGWKIEIISTNLYGSNWNPEDDVTIYPTG